MYCSSVDPTGWISAKLGTLTKICGEIPLSVEIGHKYRALSMKAHLYSLVSGDINSPQKRSLRLKRYQAFRINLEVLTLRERVTMLRCTALTILFCYLKYCKEQLYQSQLALLVAAQRPLAKFIKFIVL